MSARWLGVVGCLLVFTVAGQADPTVQTFDGGGTPYTLTYFSGTPSDDTQAGPSGKCCRIVPSDNSSLSTISFDRTQVGPVGHVVVDFDFRIGGSTDGRTHGADGIGFVLLNTAVYDITGDGPQITEDAVARQSFGVGFDTWHNEFVSGGADPNDNHVSVAYYNFPSRNTSETDGLSTFHAATSLYPFGYRLHRNLLPDNAPFDHAHITLDATPDGGANVSVVITPAGKDPFTAVNNLFIPGFTPYEMRAAFGARTGGENDNHDIDNINISYSP